MCEAIARGRARCPCGEGEEEGAEEASSMKSWKVEESMGIGETGGGQLR